MQSPPVSPVNPSCKPNPGFFDSPSMSKSLAMSIGQQQRAQSSPLGQDLHGHQHPPLFFMPLFQSRPAVSFSHCLRTQTHLFHMKKISSSPTQEDHFAPEIEHAILGMQPRHLKNSSVRSLWCHVQLCQLPGQTDGVPVGRPSPHKAINDHGALQQTNWCLAAGWAASCHTPTQRCLPASLLPSLGPLSLRRPGSSPCAPHSCCSWKALTPDKSITSPNVAP